MVPQIIKYTLVLITIAFTGCHSYHVAEVTETQIKDPRLGWNGYTVDIPENYEMVPIKGAADMAGELEDAADWLIKEYEAYRYGFFITYDARFLFRSADQQSYILFYTERCSQQKSLCQFTSQAKHRLMYNIRDYQRVRINNPDALFEEMTMNGMMGCRVSGELRPSFKQDQPLRFYEGYFFCGHLTEMFWIEGVSTEEGRPALQRDMKKMAESLINPYSGPVMK